MKHQTQTMIKNAMIILAASSALSTATCSFGDSQDVDYAEEVPAQQNYECHVSSNPDYVITLNDNRDDTPNGCAGLNKYNKDQYLSADSLHNYQVDQEGNLLPYVQVFSTTIHLEQISASGAVVYGLKNKKEDLRTYCAPVICEWSDKAQYCTDIQGHEIPCP